ncbi:MAG: MgtC/SapB family protein [Actinomycetota bacterium]
MVIFATLAATAGPFHLDGAFLTRILLATAIGYGVGWERELRGSIAGDRTFALVALGAAAVTAVGVLDFPASAEKVIAGVVTGLGFLGAGVIFRGQAGEPQGLTTAASMWSTAGAAILIGAGQYFTGFIAAVVIVFVLEIGHLPVLRRLDDRMREWRERHGTGQGG